MSIKNKELKEYIRSNTTSTIRSRGNALEVINLRFSEDSNSARAFVIGSMKYEVNFYGLKSGLLLSTCTCPFDHGPICKHEVAVANAIDEFSTTEQISPISEKTTYSKTKPYVLPFNDLTDISDKVLQKNTTKIAYRERNGWNLDIEEINLNHRTIDAIVLDHYSTDGNRKKSVTLKIEEDALHLTCTCIGVNKTLCKHQARLLYKLREDSPHVFLSEEKINEIKKEKIKEYGFSLDDPTISDYFDFKISRNGIDIYPKQKGIQRLSNFNDFSIITEELLNDEQIISSILPQKTKKKIKKEGIAIAVTLANPSKYSQALSLTPLKGNLNAQQELSSKIVEIDASDYLINKNEFSIQEQSTLDYVFRLTEYALSHKSNPKDTYGADKIIIEELKKIIPSLKGIPLYLLKSTYKIAKRDLIPITISLDSPKISFKLIEEESFYLLESYITINGKKAKISNRNLGDNFLLLQVKNNYYLIKSIAEAKTIFLFRKNPELRFPKLDYANYYTKLIQPLSEKYTVEIEGLKLKKQKPTNPFKKQLFLSSFEEYIIFKPAIGYQSQTIQLSSKKQFKSINNGSSFIVSRDKKLEQSFKNYLKTLHPDFLTQDDGFLFLSEENFIKNTWFINFFETLKQDEIEVFGYNNLKLKYNQNKPNINITVSSDIDWFDVNITVTFGDQIVGLKDLKKNIINKDKYIPLKDGSIGILPEEWLEKYLHLFRSGEVKKDSIGVSKYQFSVVDTLYEELQNENNLFDEHIKIKEKIANFDAISNIRQPRGLNAKLRSYQKEGIKWLNFLDDFKLGGCLADDMGLGKTLQVISFIKHLKTKNKSKIPHLIIVPTSLVFNWNEEVQKFCPDLKVFTLTGTNRDKNTTNFKNYDIILTTYGIIINDIDYLKKYKFNYIILDESQAIKNPNSKRFKGVRLLKAENRLVLTGTPIENNTFDLYAQMTFINPGLLGGINHFKKEYATAIDKNKDKKAAKELKSLIDPFLLRRTKEQVATELPSKTEQFLYCTMGKEQRKLYEAYKNKYKNYLLGKIEDDGLGKSKMYVLEGLTKLRQICDSPSLLSDEEEYTNESVKIDELVKHITEKTNDHKILIFSQFVKMLNLIKNRLNELEIKYEYLDGKTKNRQEKVDNFQNNEDTRVFLISLKAGGTGLNLTAADYVYIVDPWWNPAVEAQAIDRCYRIGQKKKVMAYKMICKDTIEEKIVTHQQNKKQVSNDLIQTEDSYVKSLNKESIQELFS